MNNAKATPVPKTAVKKTKKEKIEVIPTFESIFNAVRTKASKAKFTSEFIATQITLKGRLECSPLYVKIEDGNVETAPYEYNNASFYIDADTDVFVQVLNGKKDFCEALAEHSIEVNGDPVKAILFTRAML